MHSHELSRTKPVAIPQFLHVWFVEHVSIDEGNVARFGLRSRLTLGHLFDMLLKIRPPLLEPLRPIHCLSRLLSVSESHFDHPQLIEEVFFALVKDSVQMLWGVQRSPQEVREFYFLTLEQQAPLIYFLPLSCRL